MPQVIQGYHVNVKPSDTTAESTYVSDIIAAGAAATTIHYPAQRPSCPVHMDCDRRLYLAKTRSTFATFLRDSTLAKA